MGDFYKIGYSNLSSKEIDEKVLQGEEIGYRAGYMLWDEKQPKASTGWRYKVIASRGCGNEGRIVALPTNGRTFEIFKKGRVTKLIRDFSIPERVALTIFDSQKGLEYASEDAVIREAIYLYYHSKFDIFKDEFEWTYKINNRYTICRKYHIKESELSTPRFFAALNLARRIYDSLPLNN